MVLGKPGRLIILYNSGLQSLSILQIFSYFVFKVTDRKVKPRKIYNNNTYYLKHITNPLTHLFLWIYFRKAIIQFQCIIIHHRNCLWTVKGRWVRQWNFNYFDKSDKDSRLSFWFAYKNLDFRQIGFLETKHNNSSSCYLINSYRIIWLWLLCLVTRFGHQEYIFKWI